MTWIAFTITSFRMMTGWSLERFLSEDGRHGIIRFSEENYELLHYKTTQLSSMMPSGLSGQTEAQYCY